MATKKVNIIDLASTYVSPNSSTEGKTYEEYIECFSTQEPHTVTVVDSSVEFPYNVFGEKSHEHINLTSTQINVDDVIWQCNHDERFPEFGGVTKDMIKKGDNTVYRELKYDKD